MRAKVAKLYRLGWREPFRLLGVWWTLLWLDLVLRFRVGSYLRPRDEARPSSMSTALSREQVARWKWRVDVTARHHVPPKTCLVRSLCLRHWLRKRGCPAVLRIGVARERGFGAHAWVEVDGHPIGEPESIDRAYGVLRCVGESKEFWL